MFKYLKRLFFHTTLSESSHLTEISKILKYRFSDNSLLLTALTHRSYLAVSGKSAINSNERLEFLGDAILDMIVTEFLYNSKPHKLEGKLSKIKAVLVSRRAIADSIKRSDLNHYMLMNYGEEKTGGKRRTSNLANLYEAIVAAIYLDGGLDPAREFVKWTLLDSYKTLMADTTHMNYKSILLEYAQKKGIGDPVYQLISEEGPDHEKTFVIDVRLTNGEKAKGAGRNKKGAEQRAARELLKRIAPDLIAEHKIDA
jgi:ribonuclease-3